MLERETLLNGLPYAGTLFIIHLSSQVHVQVHVHILLTSLEDRQWGNRLVRLYEDSLDLIIEFNKFCTTRADIHLHLTFVHITVSVLYRAFEGGIVVHLLAFGSFDFLLNRTQLDTMGDSWRGDAYRPRGYDNNYDYDRGPPPDRYARDRVPPPRDPRDSGGFHFRGAAQPDSYRAQTDTYRPQEQRPPDFSFRAAGPPAPHFPPAAPGQYSQQAGQQRRERRGNDRGGRGGGRGRGRGGRSRAAHARDLMSKSTRGATPEQMEGMNDEGKAHYVDDVSSSSEEEDAANTGGDNDEQPSTKRTKTRPAPSEAAAAPKWSNPDPYTVLPPTDMSMAPKKDIVQTIRKAKVEAANKASSANAIKENVDFISFDDFNDEAMDEPKAEVSEDGEIEDGDGGGGGVDLGFDITPQFDREPSVGVPPPPPPEVEIPDTRELAMHSNDFPREQRWTSINGGQVGTILSSNKRKRGLEPASSTAGVIVSEWVSDGSNPTPWFRDDDSFTSHVGLQ